MGPDLFGIVWATAFVVAVVLVFAAVDRAICGAWAALRESPGLGLVAGLAAWGREDDPARRRDVSPGAPDDGVPPEPLADVTIEHMAGPGLLPWHGGHRHAIVAEPC